MRTNMIAGGVIMCVGDVAAQRLADARGPLDWKRTLVCTSWAGLFISPFFLSWFRYLDHRFPGAAAQAVVTKVGINQLVVPIPTNAGFLTFSTMVEDISGGGSLGNAWDHTRQKLDNSLLDLVMGSMLWWSSVNLINFAVVPPQYRVLPTIFAGCAWNTYLSLMAHHSYGGTKAAALESDGIMHDASEPSG